VNFDGSFPVLLTGLFAEADGFLLELDGVVGFGYEERDENELNSGPDEEDPECPSDSISFHVSSAALTDQKSRKSPDKGRRDSA